MERYKGCNVIDINPGAGLWSSKIHAFLKPRSHLLVEPNKKVFFPLLKPLLDEPGSKYKFVHKTLMALDLDSAAEKAEQLMRLACEPRIEVDKALSEDTLILASLTTLPVKPDTKRKGALGPSSAEPFLYSYLNSILNRIGFNSRGLVRMLVWVMDTDKYVALPRSVNGIGSRMYRLDQVADVAEVAGALDTPFSKRMSRDEICSAIHVAQKMKDSGIVQPENRSNSLHQQAMEGMASDTTEASDLVVAGQALPKSSSLVQKILELDDLEKQFSEGAFVKRKASRTDQRSANDILQYNRMATLRAEIDALVPDSNVWSDDKVDKLARQELHLNQLECESRAPGLSSGDLQALKSTMKEISTLHAAECKRLSQRETRAMTSIVDNRTALQQSPPLLTWDAREREPLEVQPAEFYPKTNLALLDIRPRDPSTFASVDFVALAAHPLVKCLRAFKTLGVADTMERINYGAAEALLPLCPTVNDPLNGGRIHVDNLRVRMLTPVMLKELCEAWDAWPYRLSEEQMKARAVF